MGSAVETISKEEEDLTGKGTKKREQPVKSQSLEELTDSPTIKN